MRYIGVIGVCLLLTPAVHGANEPVPLPNVQVTCYLNSWLQCLYNLTELRERILASFSEDVEPPYDKQSSVASDVIRALYRMDQVAHNPSVRLNTAMFREACSNIAHKVGGGYSDVLNVFLPFFRELKTTYVDTLYQQGYIGQSQYTHLHGMLSDMMITFTPTDIPNKQNQLFFSAAVGPEQESGASLTRFISELESPDIHILNIPEPYMFIYFLELSSQRFTIPSYITFTTPDGTKYIDDIPILVPENSRYQRITYALNSVSVFIPSPGHYVAYVMRNGTWWRCDDTEIDKITHVPNTWDPDPNTASFADPSAYIIGTYPGTQFPTATAQMPGENPKLVCYEVTHREYHPEHIRNQLYALYQAVHDLQSHIS